MAYYCGLGLEQQEVEELVYVVEGFACQSKSWIARLVADVVEGEVLMDQDTIEGSQ